MRKTALFLCTILILGLVTALPASAAKISFESAKIDPSDAELTVNVNAAEVLANIGFEYGSDTAVTAWRPNSSEKVDNVGQSFFGSANINRTTDAKTGSYAMEFTNTQGGHARVSQQVDVIAGVTYELSAWVKTSNTTSGRIYIQGYFLGTDADGNSLSSSDFDTLYLYFQQPSSNLYLTANTWTKQVVRFTAPQGATDVILYPYLNGNGHAIFDDVSLLIPKEHVPKLNVSAKKDPILTEDSATLGPVYALNSNKTNFEGFTLGSFIAAGTNPGGHNAQISNAYNHTEGGSQSLYMRNKSNNGQDFQPNFYYSNVSLIPGATYQLSTWIIVPDPGTHADFSYWIDFNLTSGDKDQIKKHWTVTNYGWWREVTFDFEVPLDIKNATIQLRLMSNDVHYYIDDITLYMIDTPDYAHVDTDELFYYTEWETGVCSAIPSASYGDMLSGGKVKYTFLSYDKTTVLDTKEIPYVNGAADYVFNTSLMAEKGKEYFVSAKVYDGTGDLVQEEMLPVYRFDRPTYLGADGVFRKNGKEYNIVFGYGVNSDRLELGPQKGGVTVALLVTDTTDSTIQQSTAEKLRRAEELGILCLIGCQGSINDPEALARTANSLKDYPALFGYKLYDEPYQAGLSDDVMKNAYAALRNADPNHPVYVDDSVSGGYDWLYRYADIIDIDYYGGSATEPGKIFTEKMDIAREATKGRKPFTLLQQTFIYKGYRPTVDELRNYGYQAFFSGATGFGYFNLATSEESDTIFMATDDWAEICERFAPWEQGFLFDCFVNGKYPMLRSYQDNNAMWRTYLVGRDIYVIAFNRQKTAKATISVPLTNADGNSLIGDFNATRMAGAGETPADISGNGTLSLTLGGINIRNNQMELVAVDGLAAEIWKVSPDDTITRGAFAEDLVEALELTASAGDNFADVDSSTEYADEIAIGKALGVFTSTNNNFSPEAELSHQDMMTWIMRGVHVKTAQLAGETINVSSVSTQELVSAWPTLEAAATLRSSLIRGAADGTISSDGFVTLYEAAAILDKISAWANAPGEEVPLQKTAGDLSVALREKMYNGFLSGTWSKADVNHANFMVHTFTFDSKNFTLFVNGGNETTSISKSYFNVGMQVYALSEGNADASYTVASGGTTGTLSLTLPRDGVALFERLKALPTDGLFKDQLVLLHLKNGAVLKMTNGAHAVLYKKNGNTFEMVEGLDNNSTLSLPDGDCVVKVFYWSAPLVATQSALTFEKQ